ncbi:MAG: serine/threonine-protein phosphatase [Nocardiopsaceae bacterium]|nr:serine/threonine-protein phosphatase [Nocardiopsaceae bacterium]
MTAVITSAAASDTGHVRSANEDSGYAGRCLFAVADGMGGHPAGEVASSITINTIAQYDILESPDRLAEVLGNAVHEANEAIRKRTEDDSSTCGMGTTLTAALWSGYSFAIAHIGDSRAYRLRDGRLHQITDDHSLGNLVAGAPSALAPIVSRYLDGRADRSPDLILREAAPGDQYLLCSDGLTSVVSHAEIHEILSSASSPDQAISQLIDLANRLGGPDNITVILVNVDAVPRATKAPPGMLGATA